jgi:hypothetical protein
MIGLSELAISVSAAARGIAEADSVGIAAWQLQPALVCLEPRAQA